MPVNHAPADDPVGPFSRLSHTQASMLSNCPRQWYHRYKQGLRGESPPILAMGRAVEAAVCRTLRDSPALTPEDAQSEWMDSPLQEFTPSWAGGDLQPLMRPSLDEEGWPGPELKTISKADWPISRNELFAWASARLAIHFERCWRQAGEQWAADSNKVGDWAEFTKSDGPRSLAMALKGVELHMEEVTLLLEAGGGPNLSTWRAGTSRPQWPAPDGFPYQWQEPHPAAKSEGKVSWVEAWELARPWFVDPDADDFSLTCIHREHWFGGEYDLIYRWNDDVRIIDIKASVGANDRSTAYVQQMRTYAWLWWDMHSSAAPDGLEIWYLGVAVRKSVEVPSSEELSAIGSKLHQLWSSSQEDDIVIDDYPTIPAPVKRFSAGGVPAGDDLDPLARCGRCDFVKVCSHSGPVSLPVADGSFTAIEDIYPYLTAYGEAYRLREELQYPFDKGIRKREFSLHMEEGLVNVVLDDKVELPEWIEGMGVRLFDVTGNFVKKGNQWMRRLKVGRNGAVKKASERRDGDCLMIQIEPKVVDVRGLAFSFDHREYPRPNGSIANKWAVRLVDDSGVVAVEGWDASIVSMLLDGEPSRSDTVEAMGFSVGVNAGGQMVLRAKKNRSGSSRLIVVDSS